MVHWPKGGVLCESVTSALLCGAGPHPPLHPGGGAPVHHSAQPEPRHRPAGVGAGGPPLRAQRPQHHSHPAGGGVSGVRGAHPLHLGLRGGVPAAQRPGGGADPPGAGAPPGGGLHTRPGRPLPGGESRERDPLHLRAPGSLSSCWTAFWRGATTWSFPLCLRRSWG